MAEIILPEKIQGFLKEYKALCDKWGCLVLSDGESVEVVERPNPADCYDYWGIDESTLREWKREQAWNKRQQEAKP